jgi:hypothetical protein
MRKNSSYSLLAAVLIAAGSLLAMPVHADKPSWAGGGKPEGEQGGRGRDATNNWVAANSRQRQAERAVAARRYFIATAYRRA